MYWLPVLLLLGACSIEGGAHEDAVATNTQAAPASFELTTPLFNAQIALPADAIGGADFDMNGVPLPPGSTVRGMKVDADATPDQPTLTLRFASPQSPTQVRDWLLPRLRDVGYTVEPGARGLSGTTDQGKLFRLALAPDAAGSTGTIELAD